MNLSATTSRIKANVFNEIIQGVDHLRKYPRATLIPFCFLLVILLLPYSFGLIAGHSPNHDSVRTILVVYYPFRILGTLIAIGWYGYYVRNYFLSVVMVFVPLIIVAFSEMPWKPFTAVLREDILMTIPLILVGVGFGHIRRNPKYYAVFLVLTGVILWVGNSLTGILSYLNSYL